jgi:type I site-specific restriction endonuclease
MNNDLNVAVTAGLDKSRSVAQINQDIQKIEAQLKKLKLQATLEKGKSISEIQSQINALNKQKRNLYVDLKIRQKDLKRQYRQAIANIHTQPLNVDVNTAAAQSQMTGLTNSVKTTTSETVTLADSLKKALSNTGLVISSQTALQLVRKAAQEATEAVKEYDKYATNLSIITGGSKESSYETIADLSEKSFDFKVDVSELEGAYETLLRTGKAAGELDDYLKSTVFLSKVGFEDVDTSAENLVTIGNAFKLQSDEIENVVSSLLLLIRLQIRLRESYPRQ